ncbi:16S rRNA (guanine(966)-N(2))-methyltransferase RsmD [Rubritalea tangerina]|uniref:16S rRNA (Guanine(966)-N(2))-methyltransferase RsmD n=1 Tax=Rubritalea tangerina TaxID=430798 RepID=A0ABW4Z745_9BACT
MRIIAGSAKRREIRVPKALVRPTTDRAREALFSILQAYVDGARVLDLFAGAGSLGLEALSRGAHSCTFVEQNKGCVKVVGENLASLGLAGGTVVQSDALAYVKRGRESFDLIFADPPYYKVPGDTDFASQLLSEAGLLGMLADDGLLVVEVDSQHKPELGMGWRLVDKRTYGGCTMLFIKKVGS